MIKVCSKCNKKKDILEFSKDSSKKSGFRTICKECAAKTSKANYHKHIDRRREYAREYYRNHREKCIEYNKKSAKKRVAARRGLTPEQRELFIEEKGSCCEVCGMPREYSLTYLKNDLCIDHCHIENINKGVLCTSCNLAAGNLKDSSELAYKLYKYLFRTRQS